MFVAQTWNRTPAYLSLEISNIELETLLLLRWYVRKLARLVSVTFVCMLVYG